MKRIAGLIVALLLAFVCSAALAEEKRWVTGDGTTLKQEGSVSATDVAPLPIGTELTVLEGGGRWLKVTTGDGKTGWVYAGKVGTEPPAGEVSGGGLFGSTLQESQITTAKSDSARSIRGLSPEVSQYAKQRGTPEAVKKQLDTILARKVTAKELRAFLREGKIGEYAE